MTESETQIETYRWRRTMIAFQIMFLGLFVAMFGNMMRFMGSEAVGYSVVRGGVIILGLGAIPWIYYDIVLDAVDTVNKWRGTDE